MARHLYDLGEVLATLLVCGNMLPAGITRGIGREHTVLVVGIGQGRHDAVGGEDDGTVEMGEFFLLLPPSVAIVAHEVGIFLQTRIVVGGQHLTVGIHVYACTLCLLKQLLDVGQVMSADEDARLVAHTDVDVGGLRLAKTVGVGLVKQSHHVDSVFSSLQHQLEQLLLCGGWGGDCGQGALHNDFAVGVAQPVGMLVVGCHSLEAIHGEFLQRAQVLVLFLEHTHLTAPGLIVLGSHLQGHGIETGHFQSVVLGQSHETPLAVEGVGDFGGDTLVVKVGIGDGGEEAVDDDLVGLGRHVYMMLVEKSGYDAYSLQREEQQVHEMGCRRLFATNSPNYAPRSECRLLALVTKHLFFHLNFLSISCL